MSNTVQEEGIAQATRSAEAAGKDAMFDRGATAENRQADVTKAAAKAGIS